MTTNQLQEADWPMRHFFREATEDIADDRQPDVHAATSSDRSKLPDDNFRSGTFPVGTGTVEPAGKGTVEQFPPPMVTTPQTDCPSHIGSDTASEQRYTKQRTDPRDITPQGIIQQSTTRGTFPNAWPQEGTFQQGIIQQSTTEGTYHRGTFPNA